MSPAAGEREALNGSVRRARFSSSFVRRSGRQQQRLRSSRPVQAF